ncbi:MAG TPA: 4-hydroxyphenylacetate 3-hydroxylase N-terminal domain-containing protein, partial [Bradyrhizobium sp.]|nr:4-hydroxyphenylacetate 3-hydroxylase N-terminal domain-containing protein [Bradyrhizobium sp.]
MGARDGKSYIAGLKASPREVWVAGRKVTDVTSDPVFRSPIAAMAKLYDMQGDPELRSTMTYLPDDSSDPCGVSFIVPRNHADLVHRRKAMKAWADANFGTMGRSPDFLNAVLVSMVDEPGVFAECNPKFAGNVERYYRYCRDN